jgi:predicted NodU family carbamoyl transferase
MNAIQACVDAVGLTVADVGQFVRANGCGATLTPSPHRFLFGRSPARGYNISRLAAFARLAEAAGASASVVADGSLAMLVPASGASARLARIEGLLSLARRLAAALGLVHEDAAGAVAALEQLVAGQDVSGYGWFNELAPDGEAADASADVAAFERALSMAAAEAGAALDDHATPLVRKARVVADVAHAFLSIVADHFGRAASSAGPTVMLAGSVFGAPDFVARVSRSTRSICSVAPCPSIHGAALGAALAGGPLNAAALPQELALGPQTSEAEAKAVLENCRLDYIYEPRWPRLLERVSRLLERGKLVSWFQGRAEFGHPFFGSRSFLCDPAGRYARDNINTFLRRVPLSTPIPLSIGFGARECLEMSSLSPWALTRASVAAEWRDRLRGAVDSQGAAHVHVLPDGSGPLADLVSIHFQRTGVPGLANVPLSAPDDVVAVSPRDAIRANYASSADALVMHRFVVMKDHLQTWDEASGR